MIYAIEILNGLLPILYGALLYLYGRYFFRTPKWALPYMKFLLLFTLGVHFIELLLRGMMFDRLPVASLFETLTVLAFCITLIYYYIESRLKIKTTGFFILILVFLLQGISSIFIDIGWEFPEILRNRMFIFHTSAAMLGYSALIVSTLYAIMYLMLFYKIKNAQFDIIYGRMPSLEELNEMNFRAAGIGFLFLTLAIALGIIWRKAIEPGAFHFDIKVIAAYSIWIIYGLVIYGKKIGHWAGKRLAYLSLSGFFVILFSMIIVTLFLNTFHRFG